LIHYTKCGSSSQSRYLEKEQLKAMDEQDFRYVADKAMNDLHRRLSALSGDHDFDADFNAGALAIEFEEPPAKFVISPNSPVRQIWLSAHSKSFKLDWDPNRADFVLPNTGQTLAQVVGDAISQQLGESVSL
jgi:CyaY protein